MAFIRSYSRRAQMDYMVGDPGLGRFFKKVGRGIGRGVKKVGRGALGLARIAAPFVPGVGGIAGRLLGRLQGIGARYGLTGDQVAQILQSRGVDLSAYSDMGDPWDVGDVWDVGDPGGRTPKRKRAASGGKAKSQSKKERKASRRTSTARKPSGAKAGVDLAKIAGSATSLLPIGRDLADTLLGEFGAPGFKTNGKAPAGGLFGRKRRQMNVANAKALRRSLRRVDGFAKLARKVQKDAASILRHVDRTPRAPARGRGHKAGCGCVVCRRAA